MQDIKSLSDEKLVELVRSSDKELYAEIVKRYEKKLLRYANYLIFDEAKAADAVQEAFIKTYINLNSFNVKRKFSSWIYRIVHNEAINIAKKHPRETQVKDFVWNLFPGRPSEQPEDEAEREDTARAVRKCLERLPLKYKEPLILYYLQEMGYSEISDVLRLPKNTVGTRIRRGKHLMRNICNNRNL